jgi:hypothetical protein
MNMFKNLFALAFLIYGVALWYAKPQEWKWPDTLGPYAVTFVDYSIKAEPFSTVICLVLALALFMVRKQY